MIQWKKINMEKTMKKSYLISRIILTVMTLIIFNIIFINEDVSWRILPFIFAAIVFGLSFPGAVLSRKILNIGNKIESKTLKILFYVFALPFICLLTFGGTCLIMYLIYENIPILYGIVGGGTLGQGLMFLFSVAVVFISIMLPYVQTLIVLILNRFIKK